MICFCCPLDDAVNGHAKQPKCTENAGVRKKKTFTVMYFYPKTINIYIPVCTLLPLHRVSAYLLLHGPQSECVLYGTSCAWLLCLRNVYYF